LSKEIPENGRYREKIIRGGDLPQLLKGESPPNPPEMRRKGAFANEALKYDPSGSLPGNHAVTA